MKLLSAFLIATSAALLMLCSGCATVAIDTTTESGKKCTATAYSLFLSLNEVGLSACGGKTSAVGMKADAEFAGAVAGAVAKALLPVP